MRVIENKIDVQSFIGKKYEFWTVSKFLQFRQYSKSRAPVFECICECGQVKPVSLWDLRRGSSKSCGCLRIKKAVDNFILSGPRNVIKMYKYHARNRGYIFDLSFDFCKDLFKKNCFYCNSAPSNETKSYNDHGTFKYNGIDRIDNTKGYVNSNVVPCCRTCNRCKSDMKYEDFLNWVKDVHTNLKLDTI